MTTRGSLLATAREFNTHEAFTAAGGDSETGEVKASSLVRYIRSTLMISFELARDFLNILVELGRVAWTSFSVVRVVPVDA